MKVFLSHFENEKGEKNFFFFQGWDDKFAK